MYMVCFLLVIIQEYTCLHQFSYYHAIPCSCNQNCVRISRTSSVIYIPTYLKLRQWPTWCTLALIYNTYTIILYTFRALHALHQEVWIVLMQHLVSSSQSVAVQCTGWERTALQFSLNLYTERPLTERTIPDAESIQSKPPDEEHVTFETCRGLYWTCCKIKQVCIKLVIV